VLAGRHHGERVAPLIVLIASFGVASFALRLVRGEWSFGPAGRIAAAVMFVFTGVSHFIFPDELTEMVPPVFPAPTLWVYLTGVAEILGGVGLLVPRVSRLSAWCLALFLVAIFPANIYAAINEVGMGGHREGLDYLWLRAPLQAIFLVWVCYFGILSNDRTRERS